LRADKGIWNIYRLSAKLEEFEAKNEAEEGVVVVYDIQIRRLSTGPHSNYY
jgi:hypothetical protein